MDTPSSIDWSNADRSDTSDAALRDAIAGTLVNARHAGSILAERLATRCVQRIVEALGRKYPTYPDADLQALVEDSAADVVLQVQAGKLTGFGKSPTGFVYITARHEIQRRARLKKGHEVLFDDVEAPAGPRQLQPATTAVFINAQPSKLRQPDEIVIRKEMLRLLGSQVGRLPARQRQVISRFREGLSNREISKELSIGESTVRTQYVSAIEQLRAWLDEDGRVDVRFLAKHPDLPAKSVHLDMVTTFAASLSPDCNLAFRKVHLEAGPMRNAIKAIGDCRAAVEALLAYVYWAIYRKSGLEFPRDFLRTVLDAHPHYERHAVNFNFW